MEITLTQKETIRLSAKSAQIVINPATDTKADISLFSSPTEKASEKSGKIFSGPGEYEVHGCMVDAIDVEPGNVSYSILAEGLHVYYAKGVEKTFSDAQLERIDGVDVLILNVKEDKAELFNSIVSQVEPKVIIPLSESEAELKVLAAEFASEVTPVEKLKVTRKDLPIDSQQMAVLKAS